MRLARILNVLNGFAGGGSFEKRQGFVLYCWRGAWRLAANVWEIQSSRIPSTTQGGNFNPEEDFSTFPSHLGHRRASQRRNEQGGTADAGWR